MCVLWMCGGDRERMVLWQTKINSYLRTIFYSVSPCLLFLAQVSLFVRQTNIVLFLQTYCKKSLWFLLCSDCPLWNVNKAYFLIGAIMSPKTWSCNFFSTLKELCFSDSLTSPKGTRQDHLFLFFVMCFGYLQLVSKQPHFVLFFSLEDNYETHSGCDDKS